MYMLISNSLTIPFHTTPHPASFPPDNHKFFSKSVSLYLFSK